MFERLIKSISWKRDLALSHGERIEKWGHRAYVGGGDAETWYGIGRRQYHFLVANGLNSSHTFLDIACGSLRLGQYLMPMLEKGNYFGLEGEEPLVKVGLEKEILFDLAKVKEPKFAFNYDFDFSFIESFDCAMAQSLFTHLTPDDIEICFKNLRPKANENSQFFSTFFEGETDVNPNSKSHANRDWYYNFEFFEEIAERTGWKLRYIGDWGHERNQKMICATI